MRQREAGRPQADDQHLAAAVAARQRAADVERVPPRQQRIDLEAPGQAEHVLQHRGLRLRNVDRVLLLVDARLHAVVADAVAGRRHHRVVDRDGREARRARSPGAQRVDLADLLIQRAAGERHAERRLLELRRFLRSFSPVRAGILALRVAPDAVVDLIQRLLGVHPGIGQRESFARAPVVLRQAQHRHAVALDGFNRNQMVVVEPVRHAEQRVAGMRGLARLRSASPTPRSAARHPAPRRRLPSPTLRPAPRSPVRSASRRTAPPARPQHGPSKSDGSGYFLTAWRCTNSRLQAWIGSSAWVSRASASVSASMSNSAATKPSRCGPSATTRSLSSFAATASGAAARPAGAHAAPHPPPRGDPGTAVQPHQALACGEVGEAEAEAQGLCVGGRHGIHHGYQPILRNRVRNCTRSSGESGDSAASCDRRAHATTPRDQRNARLGRFQHGGPTVHPVRPRRIRPRAISLFTTPWIVAGSIAASLPRRFCVIRPSSTVLNSAVNCVGVSSACAIPAVNSATWR